MKRDVAEFGHKRAGFLHINIQLYKLNQKYKRRIVNEKN
jgi:hypothetical protein